ncbi:TIGR03503 family protein [Pseudoalteromonas sp.]|uniref:TIGR03503 family protein n=1 Tax=Pseudoalteromonas sp. TaxID=53249 RepID=UPI0035661E7C
MKKWLLGCFSFFLISHCFANQTELEVIQRNSNQNELKIFDNRFRIDYQVDEITLLFFREKGTPAVILVRPDGSKIYATESLRDTSIQWFDDETYDIVKIKKPMPGPWQAIGKILPESKLMILSDIELHVDALPPLLFKGETIKVTGRLTNGGNPIEEGLFRDLVTLNVDFVSTNNKEYFNFGAKPVPIAELMDDGKGYDERPGDGVFTGEFELNFASGEWQPEYEVRTPILRRSLVKDPIIVEQSPISFAFTEAAEGEEHHHLAINVNTEKVKADSLIYQGTIYYPNGETQVFNLEAQDKVVRELKLVNYDWGVYEVELTLFGSNINGREFVAKVDKQEFEIDKPIEKVPEQDKPIVPEINLEPELPPEPELDVEKIIFWAVVGNVFILLFGFIVIRVFIQKKPLLGGLMNKLKKNKKDEKEQKVAHSEQKSDSSDEILNLSMPDE